MQVTHNKAAIRAEMDQIKLQIAEANAQFKAFDENAKLQELLHGTKYDGYVNPNLLAVFLSSRCEATPQNFGDNREDYFKLMRVKSLDDLTYYEMAQVLNFVETRSPATSAVLIDGWEHTEQFVDFIEDVYKNMAVNVWNAKVKQWREEISAQKVAIMDNAKQLTDRINELNNQLKMKGKSRAERKEIKAEPNE